MAVAMGVARTVFVRRSMASPGRIVESLRSPTSLSSPARSSPPFAASARRQLSPGISRIPAELGGAQSLMPFHSATASALLTSMLSVKPGGWGWLSEGFATPL